MTEVLNLFHSRFGQTHLASFVKYLLKFLEEFCSNVQTFFSKCCSQASFKICKIITRRFAANKNKMDDWSITTLLILSLNCHRICQTVSHALQIDSVKRYSMLAVVMVKLN